MLPSHALTIDRPEALGRSGWATRLRRFVEAGPQALPPLHRLFHPHAGDMGDVLLPLVARRNVKRLLRLSARPRPADVLPEWDRLVCALLDLPDDALATWMVRPEVTGLIAWAESSPQDGAQQLLWLGQVAVAAVASVRGDLTPTWVARSTPCSVALPGLLQKAVFTRPAMGPVLAEVRGGQVTWDGQPAPWQALPVFSGHIGVSSGRDAWLERTFPNVEQVAELDAEGARRFARSLDEALQELKCAWPEAHDELRASLRWVVPLGRGDSWYVPGMHGLIALGVCAGRRQVRDLFHETSHHKLSRVMELASAVRNPDEPVFSPFAKGKGPVTSLLQSCWSFSREYLLIQRLKRTGWIEPAEIEREELKFRVFFDKGLPVLRRDARLTELGDAVVSCIEEAVR